MGFTANIYWKHQLVLTETYYKTARRVLNGNKYNVQPKSLLNATLQDAHNDKY